MSFLQRLKGRGIRTEQRLQSSEEETALDKIVQLDVDVYQTTDMIVVAVVVLIEGKRLRPEHLAFPKKKPDGVFFTEECVWGDFYRRIILPESVDITSAEAKVKNGVLVLVLPLLKPEEKEKVRLKIQRAKSPRSG
jgi:HSP20 family molecular chaperone IbpA